MRVVVLLVMAGCGRWAFDPTSTSSTVDGAATPLSISSPLEGAEVQDGVALTGGCDTDLPLALSGSGLAAPPSAACVGNSYTVNLTFTPGNGPKVIVVTQTDRSGATTSITRNFVLVTATIIANRSSASGSAVGQGDQVGCTLTVPAPAGVVNGDVLIGTIFTDASSGGSIDTTGWTRLPLSGEAYATFYKVAAGEPASYVFAIGAGGVGGTCESAGAISAFTGVKTSAPIDVSNTQSAVGTNLGAPSITASAATMLVLAYGSNGPATGIIAPAGVTIDATSHTAITWGSALIAWAPIASGATGERVARIEVAQAWAATSIVLVAGP